MKLCLLFMVSGVACREVSATERLELQAQFQRALHLNQQGRYQEAADLLEHILMQDAELTEVVEAYKKTLAILDRQMGVHFAQGAELSQWRTSKKMGVYMGGGTNLNKAPIEKNISLTIPGERVFLELNKQQQPQAGYGEQALLSIQAATRFGSDKKVNLAMQVQQRSTDKRNFTDYLRINAGASMQQFLNNGDEMGVALFGDVLQYDNEARFYALDMLGRYAWHYNKQCQVQLGLDWQWQHQKDTHLYDMLYTGLAGSASCSWGQGVVKLSISAGNEWALNDRPGGDQWRIRAKLERTQELGWIVSADRVAGYLDLIYQQDQQEYSPLLDNGNERSMQRLTLGGRYRVPLSNTESRWWGILQLEWQKQSSNIQLFEYEAFEGWLGVEVQW